MKYLACIFLLGMAFCARASAAQMTLGDLHKMCTSSDEGDKTACTFYILGVFEGAQVGVGSVREKSTGKFSETKDKAFCIPEGLSSAAMELTVKMKMGADLAVYPDDQKMPAISFLFALLHQEFACKAK
jgi:Rap1a immunity proteins